MSKYTEKFDTSIKPKKHSRFWHAVENVGGAFLLMPVGAKITKVNCEGLKPPYIILGNHASMVDFSMMLKGTRPYPISWVCSIEEFIGREYFFRQMGMIYKRKFTNDITVVRHIFHVLKNNKGIVGIYPEARFSLAGINERLDDALGKLVKKAGVPVVTFMQDGNFLRSPQWNKHPYRKVKVSAVMTQIVNKEETETLSAEEIQKRIEEKFVYDEYRRQADEKIQIKSKERATNIHKILYQCKHCKKEFSTYSKGTKIWCQECGSVWDMDYYGKLICENGEHKGEETFVSDWYRWERQNVREEVRSGNYKFEDTARVEILQSTKNGFMPIGTVKLTHDENGFTMDGDLDNGEHFTFNRPCETMISCHIEYDYKGRGDAIDLCTLKDTYFVFPLTAVNCLTKIHFATEELYYYIMETRHSK